MKSPTPRFARESSYELSLRPPRSGALLGLILTGFASLSAQANEADVLAVELKCREFVCDFSVTLEHADEGWHHYADAWEVLGENGEVLAKRVLRHPHLKEQPFTRSLSGVEIPKGTARVTVRAHDKLHEHGGAEVSVEIPAAQSGERENSGETSPGAGD